MRRAFVFVFLLGLAACRPSHRELLEKADADLLDQRSLVAKYIYMQLVKEHLSRDDIRYRALKGLSTVALTQSYEYPLAASSMQKIIEEYENDAQFRNEIPEWRRKLAEVWRVNLENPRRAEEVLHPLFARTDLSIDIDQEIGKTLLASRQYVEAEAALQRAWTKASRTKNCPSLKTLQMDLIQTYAVSKRCEKAIEWSEQKLPESCEPDRLSLALERANCLEINGDAVGAMKIYDELIKLNPKNMRAQYLLENIKRRERKKEIK